MSDKNETTEFEKRLQMASENNRQLTILDKLEKAQARIAELEALEKKLKENLATVEARAATATAAAAAARPKTCAEFEAEYRKINDPKAREAFRNKYAKELGLSR